MVFISFLRCLAPDKVGDSPNLDSKSWFQRWNFRQENINNSQNEPEKEKEFTITINDRPLNSVKADLIHAFLSVSTLYSILVKKIKCLIFSYFIKAYFINESFLFAFYRHRI
jgi:hypothetical protein